MSDKKYYWLKLQKDFFKRHDIRIIESMPNGKDYVLFYLKLLVESIDHEGQLRFSETIPYNEEMLATITNTNVDIVRSAMKAFSELNMIDILDDATIFMAETSKMIGFETKWAEKKREYRAKKDNVLALSDSSPTNVRQEKEIEIEKELDKDINNIIVDKPQEKVKKFAPPTVEEVKNYCLERNNGIDAEAFVAFYDSKGWMIGKNKMKSWKSAVITWEKSRKGNINAKPERRNTRTDDVEIDPYRAEILAMYATEIGM